MSTERRVVDNRVLLLGLDMLYRAAMQPHERGELLACARRVSDVLHAMRANVPVEGYYAEDEQLTEYYLLVRALQDFDEGATPSVAPLLELQRLRDVTSAPLYGRAQYAGKLLPAGRDALSQALLDTFPEWTVAGLTKAACNIAREADEISLVGLAARVQDPVLLTAARESVVLYADRVIGAAFPPPRPQYEWKVDEDLAQHAKRFVDTFNALFGEELPPPDPAHAERYWEAYEANQIFGRCVRLGYDDGALPLRHYHWAICSSARGELMVQEFWSPEIWSTSRFRSTLRAGRCPEL